MRNLFFSLTSLVFCGPALGAGLYACNESGDVVHVAYAGYNNGSWSSGGWTTIPNQACTQLTYSFTSTRYFMYAQDGHGKKWEGTHPFCANADQNFNYSNALDLSHCTPLKFFSIWIPDMVTGQFPDHYAVVISSNTQNLDHPRAER